MKIITAIGDTYLNERLKQIEECDVLEKDIQYQDGILEALSEIEAIDLLILSDNILGNYDFYLLINKIEKINKNIELIIFLKEKNIDIENFLNSKNIYKIYYLNKNGYDLFLYYFNSKFNNIKKEVKKEIDEFKKIIQKNSNKNYKYNVKKIHLKTSNFTSKKYKNINKINSKIYEKSYSKMIVITGNYGSGKSIVSTMLSQVISSKKRSTLLIDFNFFNKSISTIFNKNKYNNNLIKKDYKNRVIKINNYLNILCGIDNFFYDNDFIKNKFLNDIFYKLRNKYEYIILDFTSDINYKFIKTILISSDKIIFLLEPNLVEIKKSQNILDVYLNDFNLDVDKIKIVFNKTNKYEIETSILEELFSKFNIIGNVKYDEKYNLLINTNNSNIINKKEYEKIYNSL